MVDKGKQKPASNGGVESPSVKTLFRELKAKADKAWAAFLKPYTSLFECKSFIKCAKKWSTIFNLKPDRKSAMAAVGGPEGVLNDIDALIDKVDITDLKAMAEAQFRDGKAGFIQAEAAGRREEHVAALMERSSRTRVKHGANYSSTDEDGMTFSVELDEAGSGGKGRLSKQTTHCVDPPSDVTCFIIDLGISIAFLGSVMEIASGHASVAPPRPTHQLYKTRSRSRYERRGLTCSALQFRAGGPGRSVSSRH